MRVGWMTIIMIVLLGSCEKRPPTDFLPPLTNHGAQTLGFFVNGEPWIPYDRGHHKKYELPKAVVSENGGIKIAATRIDEKQSARNWFCIEVKEGCDQEGIYQLSNQECSSPYQTFYYSNNRSGDVYQIDTLAPHFMEITHFDLSKKILAGKFEFDAISPRDTLKIRSGRFDLNIQ